MTMIILMMKTVFMIMMKKPMMINPHQRLVAMNMPLNADGSVNFRYSYLVLRNPSPALP